MAFSLSLQSITKSFGRSPLFREITIGVNAGERLGLIGPNGSGKSTLLRIIAGLELPDGGEISKRRGLKIGYVSQEDAFPSAATPRSTLLNALSGSGLDDHEREFQVDRMLEKVGFMATEQPVADLSGGWRKRLAVAREVITEPDVLLLDEPTNHLDLEGILWLETLSREGAFAQIAVTHDRYYLENVSTRIVELSPIYREGYLSVDGRYSDFLESRSAHLDAQAAYQDALETKMRREVEWLRQNPQARTTKSQYRIDAAGRLIDEVGEGRRRSAQDRSAEIDFSGTRRQTRELLVATSISKSLGGRALIEALDISLAPGRKLGLAGPNGSGKSTLLRMLAGETEPDTGNVRRADGLRTVYFDQHRTPLDPKEPLRRALSPNGETVVFGGRSIHVAGWAKRFLFRPEQIEMPIGSLSGGEQARVMIARLMLQPADLLILDEPTNDLDISSLEVLEESLKEFPGALILVTHDRYLLDRVCSDILVLDGSGGHRRFADLAQWEQSKLPETPKTVPAAAKAPQPPRPSLTASERREFANMEMTIERAEDETVKLEARLSEPEVATDAEKLREAWQALSVAKERVTELYLRWELLQTKSEAALSHPPKEA